jgi:hypothetical protein
LPLHDAKGPDELCGSVLSGDTTVLGMCIELGSGIHSEPGDAGVGSKVEIAERRKHWMAADVSLYLSVT